MSEERVGSEGIPLSIELATASTSPRQTPSANSIKVNYTGLLTCRRDFDGFTGLDGAFWLYNVCMTPLFLLLYSLMSFSYQCTQTHTYAHTQPRVRKIAHKEDVVVSIRIVLTLQAVNNPTWHLHNGQCRVSSLRKPKQCFSVWQPWQSNGKQAPGSGTRVKVSPLLCWRERRCCRLFRALSYKGDWDALEAGTQGAQRSRPC